ncbi:MAG: hypothetical protein ACFFDF_01910 [Candidatus Odinarchaeota archaeon]
MSEELILLKKLRKDDNQNLHGENLVRELSFQLVELIQTDL